MRPTTYSFIIPFLAILTVAGVMLGLGTIFSIVGDKGTIGLGLSIIVLSGVVGFMLTRRR